jgi:hypothetical protein
MMNKYEFSLAIPVLNWVSTLASFRVSWSYSFRVCLPGSAVSTLLENFLTFFGKLLVVSRSARATLSVADRALGSCIYNSLLCRIASLAFYLARV